MHIFYPDGTIALALSSFGPQVRAEEERARERDMMEMRDRDRERSRSRQERERERESHNRLFFGSETAKDEA